MSEVNGETDLLRELVHLEGVRKPIYPAVKALIDLLDQATRDQNLITLGGGAPGMAPPQFVQTAAAYDQMIVTAHEDVETGEKYEAGAKIPENISPDRIRPISRAEQLNYFKYTASAGIKPARQAALLDTLDFCNFPASQTFAKRYFSGEPKTVSPETVKQLWNETLGKAEVWRKPGLSEMEPFQYFLLAPGSSYAVAYILRFLARAKRDFVLTDPTYIGYPEPILHYGGKIKWCPTDGKYWPVFHQLKKKLKKGDVFLYLSPSNPTGAQYSYEFTKALVKLVNRKNAFLIGDFAYRYLIYEPAKLEEMHRSYAYICQHTRNLIGINTISKEGSNPGSRIGYIFSNIPSFLEWFEDEAPWEYLSINVPAQYATMRFFGFTTLRKVVGVDHKVVDHKVPNVFCSYPAYYHAKQEYIEKQLLRMYRIRREALMKALAEHLGLKAGVDYNPPDGALFVYANFSKVIEEAYLDGTEIVEKYNDYQSNYDQLLNDYMAGQDHFIRTSPAFKLTQDVRKKNVDILPGVFFGAAQGLNFRLNFVTESPHRLDSAIKRIKTFVDRGDKGNMYTQEERKRIKWLHN
ncbi:TPA: pyridoxal phosphate-dependent aminotransferase [archaeon]|uniref:Pyridoxal phosphate-dependent aminotransferase n=1 Tax=Candidatus Naiadarchaeum limnaeum TaxID=2756139 RepID=A0A832XIJ7_9ARCH|nr:pyridoxal phosphate-dependent aminotransferase [Candidatus Naiadarchaeum limnaeum]